MSSGNALGSFARLRMTARVMVVGLASVASFASATAASLKPDITVAPDGSGDFTSVQAAIDSVPADNTERRIIFIKNGTYTEHIRMERSFVTLTGEDRKKTRLVWEINDPRKDPKANADGKGIASFNLRNASDVVIENLTIDNPANLGLKPFAVFASGEGTRIVVQDADILGLGGDTFSLWTGGMYYHRNLYVTGTYHFFGPRGTCYLRDSVLEVVGSVRNALFNEGMQDERQKFVLHRTKIVSKVPFGLGSNFRDAAWYFIDCEFPDTLKPDGQIFIQQSNDARPQPVSAMFKWAPDRVYFSGSKGPDYPWLKDNLEKSEAKGAAEITAAWTFSGQWDPESTTPPAVSAVTREGDSVKVTFAEPVTVKGQPTLRLADGQSATYLAGSGTAVLTFRSASSASPATFQLNGGAILASQASARLRMVSDGMKVSARYQGYRALDPSQPVSFDGDTVQWNGRTFMLNANTLFLDQRLDREQFAGHPYAFNNLKDAVAALKHGTAEKPMRLLTAPGVYWVDDPDDPAVRTGGPGGGPPYGMTIACDHLYFYGLSTRHQNVVFAVNRGQTQGAAGNFTMFRIQGVGLKSENVTFGNYCNVDLKFPLNPALGRPKRAEAIAQAQLFSYTAQDGVAINSAFVSRLNLAPFARTYLNCHLESSGHAGGASTYVGCTIELHGSNFSGGRNYLDCDITFIPGPGALRGRGPHRFGFVDGIGIGGACVDVRLHRSREMIERGIELELSWDRVPQAATTRGYQHNVTLDGKHYFIQESATPGATVLMSANSDQLKAFKVVHEGKAYYNVPNITGADPFGYVPALKAAAKAAGKDENYYLNIPIGGALRPTGVPAPQPGIGGVGIGSSGSAPLTIRSGQSTASLTASVTPAGRAASPALGQWQFTADKPDLVELTPGADNSVVVAGKNNTAAPVEVIITARNELGLEACARLKVEPAFVEPPTFTKNPTMTTPADGRVTLAYALNLGSDLRADESLITWYRCTDAQGANPLKVAVSRRGRPEFTYTLSDGDVGAYLMATIQPKHNVSEPGAELKVFTRAPVAKGDVKVRLIDTDFQNLPVDAQPRILPGTWTLDGAVAPETGRDNTPGFAATASSWAYGPGQAGSTNYFGLYQTARGARLFYTPAGDQSGDMAVRAKFAPNKNTGQGFGSATNQFLDVYIKYDLATRTGYGLRIQRLTAEEINAIGYKGAGAVAGCVFFLTKYKNGIATPISKKVMSSAFVSECTVELVVKNGRLRASVTSTDDVRSGDAFDYPREVKFDEPISANAHGGTGIFFTGTVGVNAVHVTGWRTTWDR